MNGGDDEGVSVEASDRAKEFDFARSGVVGRESGDSGAAAAAGGGEVGAERDWTFVVKASTAWTSA